MQSVCPPSTTQAVFRNSLIIPSSSSHTTLEESSSGLVSSIIHGFPLLPPSTSTHPTIRWLFDFARLYGFAYTSRHLRRFTLVKLFVADSYVTTAGPPGLHLTIKTSLPSRFSFMLRCSRTFHVADPSLASSVLPSTCSIGTSLINTGLQTQCHLRSSVSVD